MYSSLLLIGARIAGLLNAVAGVGSFSPFPHGHIRAFLRTLHMHRALSRSFLASSPAPEGYREDFHSFEGVSRASVLGASILGGIGGALTLLFFPASHRTGTIE